MYQETKITPEAANDILTSSDHWRWVHEDTNSDNDYWNAETGELLEAAGSDAPTHWRRVDKS